MMSAYEPFGGTLGPAVVGFEGGVVPFLVALELGSVLGLTTKAFLSLVGFGAFNGGAGKRLLTELVKPGVGFGLMALAGNLVGSSSALRLVPLSGEVGVRPVREPGFDTSDACRCRFALIRFPGGFGGGAVPEPMELTISPRKLIFILRE